MGSLSPIVVNLYIYLIRRKVSRGKDKTLQSQTTVVSVLIPTSIFELDYRYKLQYFQEERGTVLLGEVLCVCVFGPRSTFPQPPSYSYPLPVSFRDRRTPTSLLIHNLGA